MAKNFLSSLFGKKSQEKQVTPPKDDATPLETEADGVSVAEDIGEVADIHPSEKPLEHPIADKQETNSDTPEKSLPEKKPQDKGSNNLELSDKELEDDLDNQSSTPDNKTQPPTTEQDLNHNQEPQLTKTKNKKGIFARLKEGLSKTSSQLSEGVSSIFTKKKLDEDMLEDLENLLISADLGVGTASRITATLAKSKFDREVSEEEVKTALADDISQTLSPFEKPLKINSAHRPHIILMTGVNGAGKTTTIGKLASKFKAEGKSVMLAAGDTFRAAAIEQLTIWGERTQTPVVSRQVGADAAGLAYDAIQKAISQNIDVLMIDTAGRLQNRTELMDELAKIVRVIGKIDPHAPHDVILVLDATVGQNALSQVDIFAKTAGVTGLIMTKLDGTARGGVLVAVTEKFSLPIHFIGVGENIEDLQTFKARSFATVLTGLEP